MSSMGMFIRMVKINLYMCSIRMNPLKKSLSLQLCIEHKIEFGTNRMANRRSNYPLINMNTTEIEEGNAISTIVSWKQL